MKIDDKTSHNSPSIRFPEFTGEWKNTTLEECVDFLDGQRKPIKSDDRKGEKRLYPYYGASGIIDYIDEYIFDGDYILLSEDGANIIDRNYRVAFIANGKIWVNNHAHVLQPHKEMNINFLSEALERINYAIYNTGTTMPKLNQEICRKINLNVPSLSEQNKIGNLLYLLNERIATQNRLIDRLQYLIKGIMVKLQQQGLSKGTWKRVPLSSILKERTELNEGLLPVYSVSVSQGVVNQMEYLGRSFAAKDTSKYHVAHFGDLIYTKSPTGSFPYGIVKQNSNRYKVAVSPLYGVYTPANYFTGVFLQEYFKSEVNTFNYLHSLIQKGAKNTINITNQRFLDNYILIPTDSNDLQQISNLLLRLNAKKDLMQNMLQQYQEQKQYLLRQMFI